MEYVTAQGMRMPKLGLGTYRMTGAECVQAVQQALALGYRHIDTAEMYGNEEAVGEAIAASGVKRGEIHLTTKVWWENLSESAMQRAAETSLRKLRTDYVDLYLIHWPAPGMNVAEAIGNLMRVKERGQARAIGVANFTTTLLRHAVETGAPIACNQFEYHVLLGQDKLVPTTVGFGAVVTAYAPLAQGRLGEDERLRTIAAKHGATPAQIALKWLLDQQGVAAIPKAARRESQQANLDALRIELDDADRKAIALLPKNHRFVNPGFAPEWDQSR